MQAPAPLGEVTEKRGQHPRSHVSDLQPPKRNEVVPMAPTSVSEEMRAARDEMALGCAELACVLRALVERFHHHPEFAERTLGIAKGFERLELVAVGDHPISRANLFSCGRVFEDGAREINEASEVVSLLTIASDFVRGVGVKTLRDKLANWDERAIEAMRENLAYMQERAVEDIREKLAYLEELINVTFVLVDLDLDRGGLS